MIAPSKSLIPTDVFYPSEDGEPLAETSVHVDAIIATVAPLRHYLRDQGIVLTNQFLYYVQGFPKFRVAPDVMVIFGVAPGPRDNYKIWQEGRVPAIIFEITSKSTEEKDKTIKKDLYEGLEVQEYWLFDPKGEWIQEQLRGYRLGEAGYELVSSNRSEVLGLQLQVEGPLLSFYLETTGEKLLAPDELAAALRQEILNRLQAEELAEQERQRAEQERQRAEQERQRADQAEQQLIQERQQRQQLIEQLRSLPPDQLQQLGITPQALE